MIRASDQCVLLLDAFICFGACCSGYCLAVVFPKYGAVRKEKGEVPSWSCVVCLDGLAWFEALLNVGMSMSCRPQLGSIACGGLLGNSIALGHSTFDS